MKDLIVEPSVDLLESMRSVGYSLEAAVADIVDNCIDASATFVEIDFDSANGEYVAFLDNGDGMSREEAIEALRFAGKSRRKSDRRLGRFGLGLKTASLSQGKCLTVLSKTREESTVLQWDIDRVRDSGQWSLRELDFSEVKPFPLQKEFEELATGTLVVWSKLDLLIGDASDEPEFIQKKIPDLSNHLSLTFHRYINKRDPGFQIVLNGLPLKPLDPFLRGNAKTQVSPIETISVRGYPVAFTAYTLPHLSGLTPQERSRFDLGENMREFQGFYLYRNERLISRGHWFGLAGMGELTKQTRVMVDVPWELDELWQIDIKKSRAEPPASFKAHLRRLMEPVLAKGKRVHTFRGRKEEPKSVTHMWSKFKDREGFHYEINLDNPLVSAALGSLHSDQSEMFLSIFEALAQQFPLLDAYQELAGNQTPRAEGSDLGSMRLRLKAIHDAGLIGTDPEVVKKVLKNTEPFNNFEFLEATVEEIWGVSNGAQ